jgi:hypothetical protein
MNVLIKGEETPRVFLAPRTVGQEIIRIWEGVLNEDVINIFDPMASTAFTISRSKQGGETRYEVDFDVNPTPIITGENVEERIARILKSAANLDERFKVPAR